MRLFEAVKDAVSAYDAAVDVGFKPNRSKMICCPFHNDKHPSMKADKRYFCFACGARGDAIDFIANLCGLSLKDAAKKLAADFGIVYDDSGPTSFEAGQTLIKRNAERLEAEKIRDLSKRIGKLHSYLREKSQGRELLTVELKNLNSGFWPEEFTEQFFDEIKPYINDFIYVDYLYEYYILEATTETKKNDYEAINKEVTKLERKYFDIREENDNRRGKSVAGPVGERLAV